MAQFANSIRQMFQQRVLQPLARLLHEGTTPQKLAWSLAIGFVVGVNPLLGSTTLVALLVALIFRLNVIASQIANHLAYPLELALFFLFIHMGDRFFHTGRLPMRREELLHAVSHHPWETTKLLWSWEWHALIVWAVFAALVAPLLALILKPLLERIHLPHRVEVACEE